MRTIERCCTVIPTHYKEWTCPPINPTTIVRCPDYFGYERIPSKLSLLVVLQCSFVTQNGTRVFFWTAAGDIKYGTVQSTSRLADGTQVIVIDIDGGEGRRSLP
ncbi:hypothetical protein EDD16DRAFT_1480713 [Pisolithus croceorrhizus]|nr:hypothetical protein EDD16DRAFT_1480713 [Pisolithus croceorrhizus]